MTGPTEIFKSFVSECQFNHICGLNVAQLPEPGGLCILHARNPDKDPEAFGKAFLEHRKRRGACFWCFVFPRVESFGGETFEEDADFTLAIFHGEAHFTRTVFKGRASFRSCVFRNAVYFGGAMFEKEADFADATFETVADFQGTRFKTAAKFCVARFNGRTRFSGRDEDSAAKGRGFIPIFAGTEVDFRGVVMPSSEDLAFVEADLGKCRLLDTDLRKVHFADVSWTRIGDRHGVYEEVVHLKNNEGRPWGRIEQLYRALKQNYEDRRDYERAGDFHYGEKEARRRNGQTPLGLRILLTVYWLLSGYGERYWRPLLWAGFLLGASTVAYIWLGLWPKGGGPRLDFRNGLDWLRALHYSVGVMTLLKPDTLAPLGFSKGVHTVQSLGGPLLIGLAGLAIRQRLRR